MKDLREDPMSHENAHDIYKVVYDQVNLVVDVEATAELRAAERRQRIARGKPYDAFVAEWVTPEPPAHLPDFGSWTDNTRIYPQNPSITMKVVMDADTLQAVFMPNPQDLQIAGLDAQLATDQPPLAAYQPVG